MKSNILYLIILISFSSCSGFILKEKIVDNYYLIATDIEEQLDLSYYEPTDKNGCVSVIEATVFAVGFTDNYIVAKQHPYIFPNAVNNKITNYFILPINKKGEHFKGNLSLIGPLTLKQFNEKEKELGITFDLKFTIEKSNLK